MTVKDQGRRPRTSYRWWTQQEDERLTELYFDHKLADIAALMGRSISSVANRREKLGLERTEEQKARIGTGRFTKGHKTWNKGKKGWTPGGRSKETRFKPGQRSNTQRPIGAERNTIDGILLRKVSDTGHKLTDWRPVHVLTWEAEHGPVPDEHIVIFKDGDRRNFDISNLECITRAENMRRNSYHTNYPPEIVKLIQLRGVLTRKINKRSKEHES